MIRVKDFDLLRSSVVNVQLCSKFSSRPAIEWLDTSCPAG